jgi:putative ABC transport system substrate-binding protein
VDISHSARPFVALALAVACAIGLHADAAPDPRPLVLYIGHWSARQDASWHNFLAAVRRTRPALLSEARFEFVGAPDNDDDERLVILRRIPARAPAVAVAPNGSSALAMRTAAPGVPVVFSSYDDPVRTGFVTTLQPRAEPITGISLADTLDGKRLEILHEAYPAVRSVAVLADSSWAADTDAVARVRAAAGREGLQVSLLLADSVADLRALFARPDVRRYDAWYVPPSYIEYRACGIVIERMRAWRRPCIFATVEDVRDGGLMAYAQDTSFVWPAIGDLVARVLAGERPGAIPVMRPQRFILALRTSPDTGVPLPDIAVVRRADVVLR